MGDPLKDTAGPALNPMIKVVNLISLIIAPLIVAAKSGVIPWMVAAVLIIMAAWALRRSQHEIGLEEEARAQRPDLLDRVK